MVLATFAGTKVARLPGQNPATQAITLIREFGKKERLIHQPMRLSWNISRFISDEHDIDVLLEPLILYDPLIPL